MKIFTILCNKRNVLIKAKLRYCFSPITLAKIPNFDYLLMKLRENALSSIAVGNAKW